MASEVQANNVQIHPSAAGPVNLPPYPEMIMAAIEALNDPNGSNKSSISKQIEATYGNLPPLHSTLLTHHLNKMKSSGQLQFLKNNYLKPDPNAPPRRGRGRPPKAKSPAPAGTTSPPPSRPRGRPPKSRDPDVPTPSPPPKPSTTANLSGRKRGRPPKAAAAASTTPSPGGASTRGRGRPPKVKPAVAAPVGA